MIILYYNYKFDVNINNQNLTIKNLVSITESYNIYYLNNIKKDHDITHQKVNGILKI